ncbi:MAG TPA: NADH-quinone oxidoreductase subunit C [Candidatus Acidoferrales bacterium]|nr:NADH-quinone oxidoreductase subunit C [Candidatus Acidoferrales bacterium]
MTDRRDLEQNPVVLRLRAWDTRAVAEVLSFRGELTIVVPRERWRRTAEFLWGDPELQFTFLCDITGVDRFPIEPRFELNYHLVSLARRDRLRLKMRVSEKDPIVESVTPVWPTANWHEREIFDLFGVRFEGHPELERILMPEDWEGYPLRKDYPVEGYR